MGPVLKLADWNKIIQQVNDLANNPPAGCNGTSALSPVTDPHRWSKTDIKGVQDALQAICSSNTFDTIPDLWKQKTIDDINTAIANGWCQQCKQQSVKTYQVVPIHGCEVATCGDLSNPVPYTSTIALGNQAWAACTAYYLDYLARCTLQSQLATEQAKPKPDQGVINGLQGQINTKTSDMAVQRGLADAAATAQSAFFTSYDSCAQAHDLPGNCQNMWPMVAALTGHPWADKPCSPKDMLGPWRESWTLAVRWGTSGPFNLVLSGYFSPGGVPFALMTFSSAAPIAGKKAVWCYCGAGCLTPNLSWFPPYKDMNPCSDAENTTDYDGSTTWSVEYRWYA